MLFLYILTVSNLIFFAEGLIKVMNQFSLFVEPLPSLRDHIGCCMHFNPQDLEIPPVRLPDLHHF